MKKILLAAALLSVTSGSFAASPSELAIQADQARIADARVQLAAAEKRLAADKAVQAKQYAAENANTDVDDLLGDLQSGSGKPAAKPVSNGATSADISGYVSQVRSTLAIHLTNWKTFAGKQCNIRVQVASDGTLQRHDVESGDAEFCDSIQQTLTSMGKFPRPPSEAIRNLMSSITLNFKP
ncbi:cell envelope integrity protein TolA [Klebsiella variicola]|uniref:cell envelope integrity protein TolA n=1 Tax=Klebsiella variicola TaxID=244366 RepID=UPI003D08549A